ncbi:hypothetical protein [Tenacibaculum ovolyticum]|uniref:hypothetical protein n=1 Tax=Tenacibaculum ovolyticum TaxID=104270 RepID=UPI0004043ABE|nr:hypothetical protein [Tenacibaculum ovolyticum]
MNSIKEKLVYSSIESKYLHNSVYMGIEKALKIEKLSKKTKVLSKINLLKKELKEIKDPSVYYGTPPPLDFLKQNQIHLIGLEVFGLIEDYLPN